MTFGAKPCRFSSFLSSFTAAALSRLGWTMTSSTSPSLSTARHMYMRRPAIETTISSRCPLIVRCRSLAPEVARDSRSKLQHPSADGLVTDLQPALRQQILDITVAQGEAQVEPDRVPDHKRRKAVAGVRHRLHGISLASFGREPCVNVSTPGAQLLGRLQRHLDPRPRTGV